MTSIDEIIRERGITEVLHFTKNLGLTGTLHVHSVKSRTQLEKDSELKYTFEPNAVYRKDVAWLNHVNLSISDINSSFFGVSSYNWHAGRDLWWCILSFSPEILSHEGVVFTTTNNIYTGVSRGRDGVGLNSLFADRVTRWSGNVVSRPASLPAKLTTCEQAEVLYPRQLSTEFLRRIYVRTENDADDVLGQLAVYPHDVEVEVLPEKFRGATR